MLIALIKILKERTSDQRSAEAFNEVVSVHHSLHDTVPHYCSSHDYLFPVQLALMEARAQYQNMTNMELIALLLQQDMDIKKQRAETEVQVVLLEKREAELKKMKSQVRDMEDYIDKLLVRIMEQTPTLLQVRARPK